MCKTIAKLLIGLFRDKAKKKADLEEKRKELYKVIINELQGMQELELNKIININAGEVSAMIIERIHKLKALTANLRLVGCIDLADLLEMLRAHLVKLQDITVKEHFEMASDSAVEMFRMIELTLDAFVAVASKECINTNTNKLLHVFATKSSNRNDNKKNDG